MDFCTLSPPNSSSLSDSVIGSVMQRTCKLRNSSIRISDTTRNDIDAINSSQQHPTRHTCRHTPYQKSFHGYVQKESKSPDLLSSVAELIGQTDLSSGRKRTVCVPADLDTANKVIASIQGADHYIPADLQQAMVAEALKRKIRHRERCRVSQARYRQRQIRTESTLNDAVVKLKAEVEDLERKCKDSVCVQTTPTIWALASEYFRQFNCYVSSPGKMYKVASKFLHDIMAPNVMEGALIGVEAQVENWRLLALYFAEVHVDLKGLTMPMPNTLIATTVTSVIITNKTLRHAFPHLNSDDAGGTKGGTWSSLASRLLGRKLVMRGSVFFGWDSSSDKVVRVYSQADMVTPMLTLLGNLEDVSFVFDKARVTPECSCKRSIR